MSFVFAASLGVALTMILALSNLMPLTRTQVFFLTTYPRENTEISLKPYYPSNANFDEFKMNFIKEYIKARNEIIPNAGVMKKKWDSDGLVRAWSTDAVYSAFVGTTLWNELMNSAGALDFDFSCRTEFTKNIAPRAADKYAASFRYFCIVGDQQTVPRDYTIAITLKTDNPTKWSERLDNPLGVLVVGYDIESGGGDPLDFQ
ncbi:MAG: type IV secretion system protein [Rickettsiales bacterium]|jgi:type IV secretory pathway component VirB8|nr:type IV secretion system protein [Rickettsiales bacterium]